MCLDSPIFDENKEVEKLDDEERSNIDFLI
jgi:hypothetical protein